MEVQDTRYLVKQYETTHLDTHIELIHSPQQYFQKLHLLLAAGMPPDVMLLNSWSLPEYAVAEQLRVCHMAPHDKTDFFQAARQALSWQGQLYAWPRDVSSLVVYVNLDRLKQAGVALPKPTWTWQQFESIGQPLTHPDQHLWAVSFQEQPLLFWLPLLWSHGGRLWSPQGTLFPDTRVTLAALSQYQHWRYPLKAAGSTGIALAPRRQEVGDTPMAQLFVQGQLAFFISGRWSTPLLRQKARFHWDILPLPQGPNGSVTGIDATGYGVSVKTHYPRQADDLARFLTSQVSLRQISASGLVLPARQSVATSSVFLQGLPAHSHYMIESLATGMPTPSHPNWNSIQEQLNAGLLPVWNGVRSPQAALADIHQYDWTNP